MRWTNERNGCQFRILSLDFGDVYFLLQPNTNRLTKIIANNPMKCTLSETSSTRVYDDGLVFCVVYRNNFLPFSKRRNRIIVFATVKWFNDTQKQGNRDC